MLQKRRKDSIWFPKPLSEGQYMLRVKITDWEGYDFEKYERQTGE